MTARRWPHGVLLGCLLFASAPSGLAVGAGAPSVVSATQRDIDADGRPEQIEVVLREGRRYRDVEPWCGGGEKWEGQFAILVLKGRTLLSEQSLNALMAADSAHAEPLFFWTPRFALVFADYRGAGGHDFNLGQYASCNGNAYRLFTVMSDGQIRRLPIEGAEALFVSGGGHVNSTPRIRARDRRVVFPYYDNSVGKWLEGRWKWNGSAFARQVAPQRRP